MCWNSDHFLRETVTSVENKTLASVRGVEIST